MKTFNVEIVGITPLMHHRLTEEEFTKLAFKSKAKKTKVKDRVETPREMAEKHLYADKKGCYIPMDYISGAMSHVGSDFKQTKGKRTYKAIMGGVFTPCEEKAYLLDKKGNVITKKWEVDLRKGNNRNAGKSCAIIVIRPRFDDWKCKFSVRIDDSLLPPEIALEMLEDSGRRAGIGSFRVSNSGRYGQYSVTKFQELK